jgi:hypothetical protein
MNSRSLFLCLALPSQYRSGQAILAAEISFSNFLYSIPEYANSINYSPRLSTDPIKVALVGMEADEYQKYLADKNIKKVKAMKSSR